MSSRERVRLALDHREADRVPIDFGAMRSTGISAIAYNKLKTYLGIKGGHTKLYDVLQQLAEPEPELVERFHADVVQLHRREPAWASIEEWKEGVLPDGSPCLEPKNFNPVVDEEGNSLVYLGGKLVGKRPNGGLYYDFMYHPCEHVESTADIDKLPLPSIPDDELVFLKNEAIRLRGTTDKAILGAFGGNIFEVGQIDFTYERYFSDIALEPELIHHYNDRLAKAWLVCLERYLGAVGEYIDVIQFGDDLGTQISSQISPQMYREMIKPYHAMQYQWVQNNYPDVRVFLHCCGAISNLIPDLIDAGVQVLNPVQLTASGMDPAMLKKEYGKSLVFWGGGCNTSTTATNGTPEDIRREVKELMGIFAPGGGYVFTQVHNIQANVPPENTVAIYEAGYEFGKY
ncbi:MAG: methyltransferase [Oscillospiraceae bacterium]|nr:methyltransferase [Oscillospiraceae bacterium]